MLTENSSNEILISIVIPVLNGDEWLESCLSGITRQSIFNLCEIIVIDSGSTDNSLSILRRFPVTIHHIPRESFNHGATRNLGASLSKGKFIAFTVQDAVPVDEFWLERLYCEFSDPDVDAVCGSQIVRHSADYNPIEWFRPVSNPIVKKIKYDSAQEYLSLSPDEKLKVGRWDDVNAMYRRKSLIELPFREVVFGEDVFWANDALKKGYTLCYQPLSRVYHYHFEDYDYSYKRYFTTLYLFYKAFGVVPESPNNFPEKYLVLLNVLLFKSPGVSLLHIPRWWIYNVQRLNAKKKVTIEFLAALQEGEDALDRLHELHCGTPPIPLKNN